MTQLGGHAIFLDADKTQVSHGETPAGHREHAVALR